MEPTSGGWSPPPRRRRPHSWRRRSSWSWKISCWGCRLSSRRVAGCAWWRRWQRAAWPVSAGSPPGSRRRGRRWRGGWRPRACGASRTSWWRTASARASPSPYRAWASEDWNPTPCCWGGRGGSGSGMSPTRRTMMSTTMRMRARRRRRSASGRLRSSWRQCASARRPRRRCCCAWGWTRSRPWRSAWRASWTCGGCCTTAASC
mmetsp:Transcript_15119/g.36570  ORF Transcript_15119/g.36570 Transcript_15119/m.36570 type:complete len:204 (+) Transcript_15119:855-1466(+)